MKNKRIRKAMLDAAINQTELAKLLGMSEPALSIVMKFELAVKEQNEITAKIREWDALRHRGVS